MFINLVVKNNFEGFVALVDIDFVLLILILAELAVHFISFGKIYFQHNSRFMRVRMSMLIICLILSIMSIAQITSYRNEKLTDTNNVAEYDHYSYDNYSADGKYIDHND